MPKIFHVEIHTFSFTALTSMGLGLFEFLAE